MGTQTRRLERSTVFDLLADPMREALLRRLTVVESTTIGAAATWIVESAGTPTPRAIDPNTVTVELVHHHVPRLAAHDVVIYDRDDSAVAPGRQFEVIAPYVSADDSSPVLS